VVYGASTPRSIRMNATNSVRRFRRQGESDVVCGPRSGRCAKNSTVPCTHVACGLARAGSARAMGCEFADSYMWSSVQPCSGSPQALFLCSVWRTDGHKPAASARPNVVGQEILHLPAWANCFIALAYDNFYPRITLTVYRGLAKRQNNARASPKLQSQRASASSSWTAGMLPQGPDLLHTRSPGSRRTIRSFWTPCARSRHSRLRWSDRIVTEEGLKSVYKDFNCSGDNWPERLRLFKHTAWQLARLLHLRLVHLIARIRSRPPRNSPERPRCLRAGA